MYEPSLKASWSIVPASIFSFNFVALDVISANIAYAVSFKCACGTREITRLKSMCFLPSTRERVYDHWHWGVRRTQTVRLTHRLTHLR